MYRIAVVATMCGHGQLLRLSVMPCYLGRSRHFATVIVTLVLNQFSTTRKDEPPEPLSECSQAGQ